MIIFLFFFEQNSAPSHFCRRAMNYSEHKLDLFKEPATTSLAHCVSRCLKMGRGVAVEFRTRFKCVEQLKEQKTPIGGVAILHTNTANGDEKTNRFIYYLVTKQWFYEKPTYKALQSSLEAMKAHAMKNNVKCIAMPHIGCGLDKLDWAQVKKMIQSVFDQSSGIEIRICDLKLAQ